MSALIPIVPLKYTRMTTVNNISKSQWYHAESLADIVRLIVRDIEQDGEVKAHLLFPYIIKDLESSARRCICFYLPIGKNFSPPRF